MEGGRERASRILRQRTPPYGKWLPAVTRLPSAARCEGERDAASLGAERHLACGLARCERETTRDVTVEEHDERERASAKEQSGSVRDRRERVRVAEGKREGGGGRREARESTRVRVLPRGGVIPRSAMSVWPFWQFAVFMPR